MGGRVEWPDWNRRVPELTGRRKPCLVMQSRLPHRHQLSDMNECILRGPSALSLLEDDVWTRRIRMFSQDCFAR